CRSRPRAHCAGRGVSRARRGSWREWGRIRASSRARAIRGHHTQLSVPTGDRTNSRRVTWGGVKAGGLMKRARVAAGTALIVGFVAAVVALARMSASDPWSAGAFLVSTVGAGAATVAIGSLYEWIVHRFVYHAPSGFPLLDGIYEIHQRGHHWHRFPP